MSMPEYFEGKTENNELVSMDNKFYPENVMMESTVQAENGEVQAIIDSIKSINFTTIILIFLFYFIGGYLFYATSFAAIGSAVDNEADTQQFVCL